MYGREKTGKVALLSDFQKVQPQQKVREIIKLWLTNP